MFFMPTRKKKHDKKLPLSARAHKCQVNQAVHCWNKLCNQKHQVWKSTQKLFCSQFLHLVPNQDNQHNMLK